MCWLTGTIFCSHNYHKIVNYFSFELEEKNLGQFTKNYRIFYPTNFHKALKNIGLGFEIRKKPIPDPGSRGPKGTGSRMRIRNTAFYPTQLLELSSVVCSETLYWACGSAVSHSGLLLYSSSNTTRTANTTSPRVCPTFTFFSYLLLIFSVPVFFVLHVG